MPLLGQSALTLVSILASIQWSFLAGMWTSVLEKAVFGRMAVDLEKDIKRTYLPSRFMDNLNGTHPVVSIILYKRFASEIEVPS
jgi:hypothetical protein